jgi:uncharacterized membrane protein
MSGILGSIAILLGVTGIGFIPVPTPAGHATIMHVPAILGGVLEGPVVGFLVGAIFGIFSFLRATVPLFTDPLVSVFPRLWIGVTAYLTFVATKKINTILACVLAGAVGTATNTILVLGMAVIRGFIPANVAMSIAVVNGVPEMVVAAILMVALYKGIERVRGTAGHSSETEEA